MRLLLSGLLFVLLAAGSPADLQKAEALYRQTRYREALQLVQPFTGKDAAAQFLAGRAAYGLADYKKAVSFLESAVASNPNNADYIHWLGRAFGMRADTALPITAPHYASKARQNFEKAVQVNPANGEALNDLFEYYLQAPGFLGGGLDKAQSLIEKIRAVDPAEAEFALSKLHEARKDFHTAEQHLRRAADLAPKSVGRVLDVARFFARHNRFPESVTWLQRASKLSPKDPQVLFKTAQTYIEAKQNIPAAKAMLEEYLRSPLNPDLPPRADAEKLLKQASGL